MPDLSFQVERAEAVPFAADPQLAFHVRIGNMPAAETIHAIALRCQIRIEPARRQYQPSDKEKLRDLFGEPERWGQTLRGMLWTHTSAMVPAFSGSTVVALTVPCTFDFNVAATKYFAGLEGGEVPLSLLFSGTVFHEAEDGALQVAQVSWEKEARFRLPVCVWREMMDHYYPNAAWLCVRRDVFDRLHGFKMARGIPTWEATLEQLLSAADKPS